MGRTNGNGTSLLRMTQKETVLMDWVRRAFAGLGPGAMRLMESVVLHEEHRKADAAARRTSHPNQAETRKSRLILPAGVQTLRGIDRFFRRIESNDGEAAFWWIRRITGSADEPRRHVVPPEVCSDDPYFRNDYHVYPTHVFASQKRAVTCWQKRYVDCFGRRAPAEAWPFPSTLCQVIAFWWMLSERIFARLRQLSAIPTSVPTIAVAKRPRSVCTECGPQDQTGNFCSECGKNVGDAGDGCRCHAESRKDAKAKKLRHIFLFDYPCYLQRPRVEGAAPEAPDDPLPLLFATKDVVERYYAQFVDKLLFLDADANTDAIAEKDDGKIRDVVELEVEELPLLVPTNVSCLESSAMVSELEADLCALTAVATMPKKKKLKRNTTVATTATATPVHNPDGMVYAEPSGPFFLTTADGVPLFLLDEHASTPMASLTTPSTLCAASSSPSSTSVAVVHMSSSKMVHDFDPTDESDAVAIVEVD